MSNISVIRLILPAIGILLMTWTATGKESIRVACVGDSITYGDKILFRRFRSYPAVLQKISDGRFTVGNFGVNGATALELQGRAWSETEACRDALAFRPDIVVLMLGINDLFVPDRYDRYPAALRKIVMRFQALPSTPRIFLCTLTPVAPAESQQQLNQIIHTVLNSAIRQIAAETGAKIIDISAVYPGRIEFLPDGVHPSPEGAALIARTVLKSIDTPQGPVPAIHSAPTDGTVDLSIRNEARAAQHRASQWLKTQTSSTALPNPAERWKDHPPQSPEDLLDLLPLLEGREPPEGENLYEAMAAMAIALNRIDQETVFLASDRPVLWRKALLHQIVQQQKIQAAGTGYWTVPNATDPDGETFRSTTYALQAIRTALRD